MYILSSWIGAIISILAYSLNVFGVISSNGVLYPFMNGIAALLLALRLIKDRNGSQLLVNSFFGIISIVAIVQALL